MLAVWHIAVHAVAAASFLLCGLPRPISLLGAAAVVAHAALRRPPRAVPVRRLPDGSWALPTRGLDGLVLRPGSAVGPFWVRLRLGAPGSAADVLLLKDQLDADAWRRLQADLRRRSDGGTV